MSPEIFECHHMFQEQIDDTHGIRRIEQRKHSHVFFLYPQLTSRPISKCFWIHRDLRSKPHRHERLYHSACLFGSQVNYKIDIRCQPCIPVQHCRETTNDNISNAGHIQGLEYGLEHRHGTIVAIPL